MSDPTDQSENAKDPGGELEFECPLCNGGFEIDAQWLGHEVECPHCGGVVALEAPDSGERPTEQAPPVPMPAEDASPPPPEQLLAGIPGDATPDDASADRAAEASPIADSEPQPATPTAGPARAGRPQPAALTKEERDALRRRVNRVLAVVGVLGLVGTFMLLAWLVG